MMVDSGEQYVEIVKIKKVGRVDYLVFSRDDLH